MTAPPITVALATPIGELAQIMVDAHVHRVLVGVGQGQALGIVTSTDILAAIAGAIGATAAKKSPRGLPAPRRHGGNKTGKSD
jgi:CBS domain-containing protein